MDGPHRIGRDCSFVPASRGRSASVHSARVSFREFLRREKYVQRTGPVCFHDESSGVCPRRILGRVGFPQYGGEPVLSRRFHIAGADGGRKKLNCTRQQAHRGSVVDNDVWLECGEIPPARGDFADWSCQKIFLNHLFIEGISPGLRFGPGRKSGTSCGVLSSTIDLAARIAGAAVSTAW